MEPTRVAQELVEAWYPDAVAALLGGSVVTSRRTPYSDLDIVIVFAGEREPSRSSLRFGAWPVELFVHTEASWRWFVEREIPRRKSSLLSMCAHGVVLADRDGAGARLRHEARQLLAAGPPDAAPAEIEDQRYVLTDLLDDLAGCSTAGERFFIVTEIAGRAAEFVLLRTGSWTGGGKWTARRVDAVWPGFSEELEGLVREALEGRDAGLVALVDEVLAPSGGRLWEGYRRSGYPDI
ncbi:nucleotidyltransferase domain-containing protein [Streptomyces durmitorensis]|uniref:Nucleotidyltransferase domain-containing protein n=1 Tax=Streptomyces durmitorensis TaxID=319947 RepID=A0ABY4Q7P1_9ACTN|nr:nucleotidyltransferase domain-containing protein [Streptomyces durmitorensis]UQT61384.1 nucleotidyltransferase domain-containing protein [Streptomyces durmitorensis]